MAIRLIDRYPNRVDPATSNYPHGEMRNVSAPGENDGTPLEQDWGNDFNAFFQALVEAAGITPSGTVDTVPDSQYMESLVQVANGVTEVDVAGNTNVSLNTAQSRIAMVKLTGALTGDLDVIFPDTERGYVVINNTSGDYQINCRTSAGSGLTVPQGNTRWVRSDGTNIIAVLNDVSSSVDSVATLRASSFPANLERLYLSGYYGVGTRGGGPLYRVGSGFTSSDDNGLNEFVDADGVKWARQKPRGTRSATPLAPETHIHIASRPYTGWPYNNLHYIESDSALIQIFSAGADHLQTDGVVYSKIMSDDEERSFGSENLIADRESEGFIATCHASAIAPNGDILAFVRFWDVSDTNETEVYLYRSTDGGVNWSGSEWVDGGGSPINTGFGPGAPHGMYVTRGGTILVFQWTGDGGQVDIYRSTDSSGANGTYTLQQTVGTSNITDGVPLEATFVQNPNDDKITAIARRGFGATVNVDTLVYTVSTDDGQSWAPFEFTDIDTASGSPCAAIEYTDTNQVELFWTNRRAHPYDDFGSVFQTIVSYENIAAGNLSAGARRIGKISTSNDSGYIAAAISGEGEVFMSYYVGNDLWTFIPVFSSGAAELQPPNGDRRVLARKTLGTTYRKNGYKIYDDGEAYIWNQVSIDFSSALNKYSLPINFDLSGVDDTGSVFVGGIPQEMGSSNREAFQKVVFFIDGDDGQNGSVVAAVTDTTVSTDTRNIMYTVHGSIIRDT